MEYKNCPFCGGDNLYFLSGGKKLELDGPFKVCCGNCGCSGPKQKSKELAARHWNRRPDMNNKDLSTLYRATYGSFDDSCAECKNEKVACVCL